MAHIQLPTKLEPLFKPARYKVLYGGRGGAKSWGAARALLTIGTTRKIRVLCAREIQKTIADSVHKLLADQIKELELSGYSVQESSIFHDNGTEFVFTGIRGMDIGKIKSFEGVDVCWVEEAQTVSKKSWDVLIPTIRKPASEIWLTFNPDLDTDETYRRFVDDPPAGAVLIPVGWQDNPWFPDVLAKERDDLKRRDPDLVRERMGG
jgi:phage terminase large subunit